MTLEVSDSEGFHQAEAEAKQRGQRVIELKRGKTNSAWILTLSDPPEPELALNNFPARVASGKQQT